jgi:GNAT superfamily N-acetyltransferase
MSKEEVEFPAVRDVMGREFVRTRTDPNRKKLTNTQLSKRAHIATGLISLYRQGKKAPDSARAEALASGFFPKAKAGEPDRFENERKLFLGDLVAASAKREIVRSGDLWEHLADGFPNLEIKISTIAYSPISGDRNCLLESLTGRLLDLCGIPFSEPEKRAHFDFDKYPDSTLFLSLFDSLDRLLKLTFWRTPLRMSLGGICHRRHRAKAESISKVLSVPYSKNEDLVRPIVMVHSVGWTHCRNRLKLQDSQLTLMDRAELSGEKLAMRLIEETERNKTIVPVMCVDELLGFQILNAMGGQGFSVFPMNSRWAAQNIETRRELPQYYLSIAMKRGRSERFQAYLREALVQFLSTEVQTTANLWVLVAKTLLAETANLNHFPYYPPGSLPLNKAQQWRLAWDWVKFTLHLDRMSIASYVDSAGLPWKPILESAAEQMKRYFAANEETIIAPQVDLSLARIQAGHASTSSELDRLFDLFECQTDIGAGRYPEGRNELIRTVHLRLLGRFREFRLDSVREFDPADTTQTAQADHFAARSLLRNLQGLYEAMNKLESVARIEDEMKNLGTAYGGNRGRIILARSDEEDARVLGLICLAVNDFGQGKEAELRYIWVDSNYRHFGIGNRLTEYGIKLARDLGCVAVFAEILPELRDAVTLTQRYNFKLVPPDNRRPFFRAPDFADRLVYKLELN